MRALRPRILGPRRRRQGVHLGARTKSKAHAACFGVPGPVRNGRLRLTNLPWTLDSRELSLHLDIHHVFLINDLEANGYGIAELAPDQIYTLREGDPRPDRQPRPHRRRNRPRRGLPHLGWPAPHALPSEGGHADFAPRNEDEIDLLRFLKQKYNGRVSCERVVTGMGLTSIYDFLRDVRGMEEPDWLAERMTPPRTPTPSSACAVEGKSEICETMDIFVSAYGAEAGNLALKLLSVGGVYIGGGIAPRILENLKDGAFLKAFTDKGRLTHPLNHAGPRHPRTPAPLLGAAAYAEARAT